MQVEVINDREQWNAFVEAEPTGNVTQTYEWGELRDSLGGDAMRLGALENGALQGTMLMVVGEAPLLRRPYLYVPRGPVIADPSSPALGPSALLPRTKRASAARSCSRSSRTYQMATPLARCLRQLGFRGNRFATHPRRSWVLDIRPSEEDLLAAMKEKWRYNIGLAGRKKVAVREACSRRISPSSTASIRRRPRATASSSTPSSTMPLSAALRRTRRGGAAAGGI